MWFTGSVSDGPHVEIQADLSLDVKGTPMSNVTEACHAIMNNIAVQGSNFTYCMLSRARPFRLCENCVEYYTRFTGLYEDLLVRSDF